MNKGEFVEALADRLDISRAQAERALTGVLEIVSEHAKYPDDRPELRRIHLCSCFSSIRRLLLRDKNKGCCWNSRTILDQPGGF
jgi:hypothetical protein